MKYKKWIIASISLVLAFILFFSLYSNKKTNSKESVSVTEKKKDSKKEENKDVEEKSEEDTEEDAADEESETSEPTITPDTTSQSASVSQPNIQNDTSSPTNQSTSSSQKSVQQDVSSSFNACSMKTVQLGDFKYWLYTPSNPTSNMPLIVYLHGGSGRGSDLNQITSVDGFPQYLQKGQLGNVRAYVLIPQLPSSQNDWASAGNAVYQLIQSTVNTYHINSNNISLTGHSLGGAGTWSLACLYPQLFARIAPLSGYINVTPDNINKLKNIPVKAFVGSADKVVSPSTSLEAITVLKRMNAQADITVFSGADHASVPRLTYLDSSIDLIDWLINK